MTVSPKNVAQAAMEYLDELEKGYGHGAGADNVHFGYSFATECVNQIMNKLDVMPKVTLDDLNNEFKKLLKVTSSLNDSEFAYGLDKFKVALQEKTDKISEVNNFFSESNMNEVINAHYSKSMGVDRHKYEIVNNLDKSSIVPNLTNFEKPSVSETKVSPEKYKEITDRINEIPLDKVIEYIGGIKNTETIWKILDTGHPIGIKDQTWLNYNTNTKGYGGISLVADHITQHENIHVTSKKEEIALWSRARNELLNDFKEYLGIEVDNNSSFKI